MSKWKFTDASLRCVSRQLDDGSSQSFFYDSPEIMEWIAQGNTPLPVYPPTLEQLVSLERQWRDTELARADIELNKVQDGMGTGSVSAWRAYRCELRNWPESAGFPSDESKPVSP